MRTKDRKDRRRAGALPFAGLPTLLVVVVRQRVLHLLEDLERVAQEWAPLPLALVLVRRALHPLSLQFGLREGEQEKIHYLARSRIAQRRKASIEELEERVALVDLGHPLQAAPERRHVEDAALRLEELNRVALPPRLVLERLGRLLHRLAS